MPNNDTNTTTPAHVARPELGDWLHLKAYGYAPGGYMNQCHRCYQVVTGVDKRAITCRPCAEAIHLTLSPNTN